MIEPDKRLINYVNEDGSRDNKFFPAYSNLDVASYLVIAFLFGFMIGSPFWNM